MPSQYTVLGILNDGTASHDYLVYNTNVKKKNVAHYHRYKLNCLRLHQGYTLKCQTLETPMADRDDNDTLDLADHDVTCSAGGIAFTNRLFLTMFKLDTFSGPDRQQYEYRCCAIEKN